MSNEFQTTSKSLADSLLTKEERQLFSFLKEGPRTYSELCKYLQGKEISKSKTNRLLKKNVEENRIFRIEKEKNVFYKINDFPLNVNALLVFVNSAIKERENKLRAHRARQDETAATSEETHKLDIKEIVREVFETNSINQELKEFQTLRRNIILLYPKLNLPKIIQFTLVEIGALFSGNQPLMNLLEKSKEVFV